MAEEENKQQPAPPSEAFKKPEFKAPDKVMGKPATTPEPEKPAFKFEEPSWSAMPPPEKKYQFEVIKGGTVIETIDLSKRSYYVVGRMPDCHIPLQHPSLSRYHAVLQYCDAKLGRDPTLRSGWYIEDLGSSNGTIVNKKKLEPNQYRPLEIGHVIKFGMSTRLLVLQGQQETLEEEKVEETPKKIQIPEGLKIKKVKPSPPSKPSKPEGAEGCMWGISMDDEAVYESGEVDPNFVESSESSSGESGDEEKAAKKRKPLDLSDPKKTLRVFYEREDLGLPDYQVENIGKNRHRAFLDIPTESGTGKVVRVEGEGGSKKEAVAACAREACITLDKMDLLRPRNKGSKKNEVKKDWAANDYYDEEEDSFFDRTGDLEQKRLHRMIREKIGTSKVGGSSSGPVHTEQTLQTDLERLESEIREISNQLEEDERKRAEFAASRAGEGAKSGSELDALDAYMSALKQGVAMDATTRVRLKHRLLEAQKERSRCERLLSIAKGPKLPASLLANAWQPASTEEKKTEPQTTQQSTSVPNVGRLRTLPPVKFVSNLPKLDAFDEDEDEGDFGATKPKMKKLDEFLKEGDEKGEEKAITPVEAKMELSGVDEKIEPEKAGEAEKEEEEVESSLTDKKVYSVFLPPELRQSLDEHADEVDQIWDVNRAALLAKSEDNKSDTS